MIAVWSLLAADPTRDYLTLAVVGFTLFLAPWLAGFAGDQSGAAWIPASPPQRSAWPGICAVNPLTSHGQSAPTPTRATANDTAEDAGARASIDMVSVQGPVSQMVRDEPAHMQLLERAASATRQSIMVKLSRSPARA